jgi:enamine deaminase RidA (YjgF/YER057c/UK114 family)
MMIAVRKVTFLLVGASMTVALGWFFGVSYAQGNKSVVKDFINPTPGSFSGAVAAHLGGTRLVYASGHVGRGADLKAQALAAYQSVLKDLAAAGAGPEDVVKVNTYIANYTAADRTAYEEARRESFPQKDLPASTIVGVQSLVSPQFRIEIEAVAVVKE